MASPYTLQESLHPALSALGAYTSNLAQYRGQMTPYKRDPRLDNQRAFGDALTAYMQSASQRDAMKLQREQAQYERKRQEEIDKRNRELFPFNKEQAKLENERQRLVIAQEKNKLNLKKQWGDLVQNLSGATDGEKKELIRVGPSLGTPLYQKILSRGVTRELTDKEKDSLPEEIRQFGSLYQVNNNKIEEKIEGASGLVKDLIKLKNQGKYIPVKHDDVDRKVSLGIPPNLAKDAIVHEWSGGGEGKAPKIIFPTKNGRDFDSESSYTYIYQANLDYKNGKRSIDEIKNDLQYSLHFNKLFGKRIQRQYTNEAGQLVTDAVPANAVPSGFIVPDVQPLPTKGANPEITQAGADEALTAGETEVSAVPSDFTQKQPSTRILSQPSTMDKSRKKEAQKALSGLSNLAFEIDKYSKDLEENGFLIPLYDDSELFGERNSTYRALQDAIRIGKGYGAPQTAELKILQDAIGQIQNPELFLDVFKTGGNAKKYVQGQLSKLKEWVKFNMHLWRYEEQTGKVLDYEDPEDKKIIMQLMEESASKPWSFATDKKGLSESFGKKNLNDMEALIR